MLALQTEILELKANPKKQARGTVLEIERSAKKGVLAHLLVQDGTLHRGDMILCGSTYGKVRAIHDHNGHDIKEAGPSTPVQITGLDQLPDAGDTLRVVPHSDYKRHKAEKSIIRPETKHVAPTPGDQESFNVVIKADTNSSKEARQNSRLYN